MYEAEYKAKLKGEKETKRQRGIYWLCYLAAFGLLINFAYKTHGSTCIATKSSADRFVGWFHFGVIIMIELALAWQVMAGIKTDAMTITIMHVVSRIFMVLGGSQFYYIAGCAVFLMFSILLIYHIVDNRWPTLNPRQIVRRNLSSVLPQWLYSGAAGGSDSKAGGSALDGELLEELLLSPILKKLLAVWINFYHVFIYQVRKYLFKNNHKSVLDFIVFNMHFYDHNIVCYQNAFPIVKSRSHY